MATLLRPPHEFEGSVRSIDAILQIFAIASGCLTCCGLPKVPDQSVSSPLDISKVFISSLDIFLFLGPQWNSQTKRTKPSSFPSGSLSFRAAASHLHHHATVLTTTLTQQSDPAIKDEKMRSVCERDAGPDVLPGKDELCVLTRLCLYSFQAWARCLPGARPPCRRSLVLSSASSDGICRSYYVCFSRIGNADAASSPDPFFKFRFLICHKRRFFWKSFVVN